MRDQPVPTKAVVSVADMARMVGLSRARYYQLVGEGVFPPPVYHVRTRRPCYPEELQRRCLEVRRRNCGVNCQPVLFYARGHRPVAPKPARPVTPKPKAGGTHTDLLDGLKALGLASPTADQVGAAIKALYPSGVEGVDSGEVLRRVFLHLKRPN
ncbi:hypothetical protein J0H58_13210 [bacterium]|nr:hypothetical protein [bacterium]